MRAFVVHEGRRRSAPCDDRHRCGERHSAGLVLLAIVIAALPAAAKDSAADPGSREDGGDVSARSSANARTTSASTPEQQPTEGTSGYDVVVVGRRPLARDATQDAT
ncbi:MAG: hypothetical protein V2A73_04975, partial [Pseudomonadota bacterium]